MGSPIERESTWVMTRHDDSRLLWPKQEGRRQISNFEILKRSVRLGNKMLTYSLWKCAHTGQRHVSTLLKRTWLHVLTSQFALRTTRQHCTCTSSCVSVGCCVRALVRARTLRTANTRTASESIVLRYEVQRVLVHRAFPGVVFTQTAGVASGRTGTREAQASSGCLLTSLCSAHSQEPTRELCALHSASFLCVHTCSCVAAVDRQPGKEHN